MLWTSCAKHELTLTLVQSGQSVIEHSYKADSDLSPAGIEYAEKLRDFIVSKRAELLQERVKAGEKASERRLTVRHMPESFSPHCHPYLMLSAYRCGHPHGVAASRPANPSPSSAIKSSSGSKCTN